MPTVREQLEANLEKYIAASERTCSVCWGRGQVPSGAAEVTEEDGFSVTRIPLRSCEECGGSGTRREPWHTFGGSIASDAVCWAVLARDAADFDTMNAVLDEARAFLDRCLAKYLENDEDRARLRDVLGKLVDPPSCEVPGCGECGPPARGALTSAELAELGIEED